MGFQSAAVGIWLVVALAAAAPRVSPQSDVEQGETSADVAALQKYVEEIVALLPELDVEALLAGFDAGVNVDELLEPMSEEEQPVWTVELQEECVSIQREIEQLRGRGDYDLARSAALELLARCELELGAEHPKTVEIALLVEFQERVLSLPDAAKAELKELANLSFEAERLYVEARLRDALPLILRQIALKERFFGRENLDLATEYANLSQILHDLGQYDASLRCLGVALRVREELVGSDHFLFAEALDILGSNLVQLGRFDVAESSYVEAVRILRSVRGLDRWETMATLNNLAILSFTMGKFERAASVFRRSADWWQQHAESGAGIVPNAPAYRARALGNLGNVEHNLGNLDAAEQNYRAAYRLAVETFGRRHPDTAMFLTYLGALHHERGAFAEAEAAHRAALEIRRELGDEGMISLSHRNLAALLRDRGDSAGAEAQIRAALEVDRKLIGEEGFDHAKDHSTLGAIVLSEGRFAEAEQAFGDACRLYGSIPLPRHHPDFLVALSGLAQVHFELGREEEAKRLTLEVLELRRTHRGERLEEIATSLEKLADMEHRQGRPESAIDALTEALSLHSEVGGDLHPSVARCAGKLGELQWMQGALIDAEVSLRAALEAAEARRADIVGAELDRARFSGVLSHAYTAKSLAHVLIEAGTPAEAAEVLELGRERSLLDLLARSEGDLAGRASGEPRAESAAFELRLSAENAARARLMTAEVRLAEARRSTEIGEHRAELVKRREDQLRAAREELREAEASVLVSLRQIWPEASPLPIESVREALDPLERLVCVNWTRRCVSVIVVPPAGAGDVVGHVVAKGVAEVTELRDRVVDVRRRVLESEPVRDALARLAERFFPVELREVALAASRLVVVADGPWQLVPIELLGWADANGGGETLLQGGPDVVYASSASIYLNRRSKAAAHRSDQDVGTVVAVGAPNFERAVANASLVDEGEGATEARTAHLAPLQRQLAGDLRPLEGSRLEALRIEQLASEAGWSTVALIGELARVPTLEQHAPRAAYLHIGTHGMTGSALRPYSAGLALTSPREPSMDDSGFLTLDDLLRRWRGVLDGCRLVVLSACETNSSVAVGDSAVALPWGFFYAGAPCVIVSLWKVDDAATFLLMERFYENLFGRYESAREVAGSTFEAGAPMPVQKALREAKLWLRDASAEGNRATLEAAGFTLAGLRSEDDDPPPPTGAPSAIAEPSYDFSHPQYWAAFVVVGSPD